MPWKFHGLELTNSMQLTQLILVSDHASLTNQSSQAALSCLVEAFV